MRKSILMVVILLFALTSCQRKEEFKVLEFKEFRNSEYVSLEPLMIIWWTERNDSRVGYPYKKFSMTEELRTIMSKIYQLQPDKKPRPADIAFQSKRNTLRIYLSNRMQTKFCIAEIEFTLDSGSCEFVSEYGRSAELYELLSSKEESKNYWGYRDPNIFDSNGAQELLRRMGEVMNPAGPNLLEQKQ